MIPNKEAAVPTRKLRTLVLRSPAAKTKEILEVHMTADLLTISSYTVYDRFRKGELPARKVGRKWLTAVDLRALSPLSRQHVNP
jgi:hypothetical protein